MASYKRVCDQILSSLATAGGSVYFSGPVQQLALSEPIDLCAVRDKLNMSKYASMGGFSCDVHRTFANATKYSQGVYVRDNTTNLQTVLGLRLQLVKWDATLAIAAPMQALLDAFDHEPEIGSHMTKVSTKIRTIRAKARKSISEYQTVEAFVSDVRLVLINALSCNSIEPSATHFSAKKLLAMFEAGLMAYCAESAPLTKNDVTPATLRDLMEDLYAATESYFFRKSASPMNLDALVHTIERGVIGTLEAFQTALDIIISTAILYNPDPTHTVHAAALAFDCLATEAVVNARGRVCAGDDTIIHKMLEILLEDIIVDPLARLCFNIPVDNHISLIRYECSDVIEHPTNLRAVAKRLARGHYADEHNFAQDIRLFFSNRKLENIHLAYAAAENLEAFFECRLKGIISSQRAGISTNDCSDEPSLLPIGDMRRILGALRTRKPASEFFLRPVTPSMLGLEDYKRIVSRPMDLTTIEGRLKTYTTLAAFAHDVRSIFLNALNLVPDPALAVHQAAGILLKLFEHEFNSMVFSGYSKKKYVQNQTSQSQMPPLLERRHFRYCTLLTSVQSMNQTAKGSKWRFLGGTSEMSS
mmetsp:Transcript_27138/g.83625  ORF Transcript_27138/g.83625 Transcript_27138/m.83625 type:complete len:588 (+) Transcript_27138:98-1861(+)